MKVVVAGGSGLIGRWLCTALVSAGHEAVVLSRNPARLHLSEGVRGVEWHPPKIGDWAAELDGAGAVINLSGESIGRWPWTAARKRLIRESRLVPTATLIAAMGALPPDGRPRVLLNACGTDSYEGRDEQPADESTPPAGTFLARLCVDWEREALRAEELGVRVVVMRTCSIVAPGAASLRLLSLPFRLFVGGRIGSGQQWMSWIDMSDAVALYLRALESDEIHGPINLAAPDPRRQVDFARALGAALRRPSWFPTPAWAVRLVFREQATLALGSRRVWPARALALGYTFQHGKLEDSLAAALRPPT
jgi:uncharacterized protein (TIGR01777 family)